jgi:hypothetical protein
MKKFYAYAVCEILEDGTELPLYIGKGHDNSETGYSRLKHYADPNNKQITRSVREKLKALQSLGRRWVAKKLVEVDTELEAFAAERSIIVSIGRSMLLNCSDGGDCGWTLRPESRQRMSDVRRGKKLGPISDEHRHSLAAAAKIRAANPVWRAQHSARMMGNSLSQESREKIRAALAGKPNANRATKALQRQQRCARQSEVLKPFAEARMPMTEVFEKTKNVLGWKHIASAYKAYKRCGLAVPDKIDLSTLSAEERRLRRLQQYKNSYQRHRLARIEKAVKRQQRARISVKASSAYPAAPICHQRLIRDQTKAQDIARLAPLLGDLAALKAAQFDLAAEPYALEHRRFIKRYEWLGTPGIGIKWCFAARCQGELGGVVLLSEPYYPSAEDALIARGACAGWTPKNLGSRLVMFACRWMGANTGKRQFIAYADEEAGEVGQIYQACNFRFLGWKPSRYGLKPDGRRVSLQTFKRTSRMVPWLAEQGITLPAECFTDKGFLRWSRIPLDLKNRMREHIRRQKQAMQTVLVRRGKYLLVQGATPAETRRLNAGVNLPAQPYPKRAEPVNP